LVKKAIIHFLPLAESWQRLYRRAKRDYHAGDL
jgi:hypothetical protein